MRMTRRNSLTHYEAAIVMGTVLSNCRSAAGSRCSWCTVRRRAHVSDSDSLFDHLHPWMRPRALQDADDPEKAAHLAGALQDWLIEGRETVGPASGQRKPKTLRA